MAAAQPRLDRLPEARVEQVAVVLDEGLADARIAEQEGREFLREDVERPGGVPGFAGQLHLGIRCRRNATEVAVGHELDLVVIVEDDTTITGDAEVLPQHVAGEDVGAGHLADGVTVFQHGVFHLLVGRLLEVDVERCHPPLDVEVFDDHRVAVHLERRRR